MVIKMVYVFLAKGFEEIEAIATIDILRRAGIDVITVSVSGGLEVTGSHNITVKADRAILGVTLDGVDMLVFPGGPGVKNLQMSEGLKTMTLIAAKKGLGLAAICAAPSVLGAWGLLKGKKAVCFPGFEEKMIGATYTDERVVNDGGVITSKGAGTANQFAFEIVKVLKGDEVAFKIRKAMQYE